MKKWLVPATILLLGIIILGVVVFSPQDSMESSAAVTRITEDEYLAALSQYAKNPVMNGTEKPIEAPSGNALSYYRVTVRDSGYSKNLPIAAEIFLAADESLAYVEESCFTVTEPRDLSGSAWKYLNTILFAESYGGAENSVILILTVDTVYRGVRSRDFHYDASIVVDLSQEEVIQFSA